MPKKNQTPQKSSKAILYSLIVLLVFTVSSGKIDLSKLDTSDLSSIVDIFDLDDSGLVDYNHLEDLPEYDGTHDIVTINNNQTGFDSSELSLAEGTWQTFTPLDKYNRVGAANAMLQKEMMPTEKRSDISNVKPSGWKQKKMKNGDWLYNRSHLIAYRFTGENDNWLNLFTGTQQMNQSNMTIYEEKVANYLKETGNHVRFRVRPYFKEDELVPRGVEFEAKSVEDKKLEIHVFLYNVQDNYTIDYATGKSQYEK